MNLKLILSLATLVATLPLHALPTLATEHVDIGVAFDLGAFNLHIHDETNDIEYAPAAAILQVNPQGSELIPNNPLYSLLGTPGVDSVWRLPKVQNPNLLFLGVGSGEIDPGILDGDVFTFSLISVSNLNGGKFTIYDVDGFNVPTVIFNSGDGINGADSIVLPTGGHTDFNFTFSAPGHVRNRLQSRWPRRRCAHHPDRDLHVRGRARARVCAAPRQRRARPAGPSPPGARSPRMKVSRLPWLFSPSSPPRGKNAV